MKLSEATELVFQELQRCIGRDRVETALRAAAPRLGLTFDPEEEPLPERLCVVGSGPGEAAVRVPVGNTSKPLTIGQAAEAVRRYNAQPEVRRLARQLLGYTPDGSVANDAARELLAILDGKDPA